MREISLGEAVKSIITDGNPDWVRAVVQAGFIYRGVAEVSPTLRRDPYDLYSPATYNSAWAATYFRALDAALDALLDAQAATMTVRGSVRDDFIESRGLSRI